MSMDMVARKQKIAAGRGMVAGRGKILVWVDMQQKSASELDMGGVKLLVNSAFGADGNIKNPTYCRRYDTGELLLVHHNTFDMVSRGEQDADGNWGHPYKLGDTGIRERGEWLFAIDESMVQLRLSEDGEVSCAMPGWVLVERVRAAGRGKVVYERPWLQNVWRRVSDGLLLLTYNAAGSEVRWTYGGKQRSAWKMREGDVLGVLKEEILKQVI